MRKGRGIRPLQGVRGELGGGPRREHATLLAALEMEAADSPAAHTDPISSPGAPTFAVPQRAPRDCGDPAEWNMLQKNFRLLRGPPLKLFDDGPGFARD